MEGNETMGKYLVAYLLKEDSREYHKGIVEKISNKFGVGSVSQRIEPHVTLKYLRHLDEPQLNELEKVIKNFCQTHKGGDMTLEGIGHFGKEVVFIEVHPSDEMKKFYGEFISELRKLHWMPFTEHEGEGVHFHSTLAEKDISEKFDEIYAWASEQKPYFEERLDCIYLLKKIDGRWKSIREYPLRD